MPATRSTAELEAALDEVDRLLWYSRHVMTGRPAVGQAVATEIENDYPHQVAAIVDGGLTAEHLEGRLAALRWTVDPDSYPTMDAPGILDT